MSPAAITTVFTDVGGVLLTNGWDRAARKLAAKTFDLNEEEMNERHHLIFDTYEEGKLSLDEYLHRTVFYETRPFTKGEFREFMFRQSKPIPEMIALMRRIRELNRVKVIAVSNEGKELTLHRIRTFGLGSFVDFFVSSCFVHYRKPDPDIYRIAMDIAQASPPDIVYIDDRLMFVEVAADLGLRSVWHKDCASTRTALQQLGVAL